jgi:hypothetical protein
MIFDGADTHIQIDASLPETGNFIAQIPYLRFRRHRYREMPAHGVHK